jgi:hypothetical protein
MEWFVILPSEGGRECMLHASTLLLTDPITPRPSLGNQVLGTWWALTNQKSYGKCWGSG